MVPDPTDELQFQTVEPSNAGVALLQAQNCVLCRRPIKSMYFAVGDKILCPDCAAVVRAGPRGNESVRLIRAFAFGLGPAIVGALVWGAILYYAGYQIGLIAVALGFMIGKAVRKGSGGRGGPAYQAMAVFLAYASIAGAHFLDFYALLSNGFHTGVPVELATTAVLLAIKYPISSAAGNPIGLLIVGFALWEAWKFTKFYPIPLSGPHQVARQSQPLSPASLPDPGVII